MSVFQALVLALLQGITELFPVSSLGHSVVLPSLLHWRIDQRDPSFLAFLTLLHVGTATALFIYFRTEWFAIIAALVRSAVSGRLSGSAEERLVPDPGPARDRRPPGRDLHPDRRPDGRRSLQQFQIIQQ